MIFVLIVCYGLWMLGNCDVLVGLNGGVEIMVGEVV